MPLNSLEAHNEMVFLGLDLLMNKLLKFQGRSDRGEFWKLNMIILVIGLILQLLGLAIDRYGINPFQNYIEGLLSIFSLLTTLPLLAIGSRRLHDIGKSGWWQLLILTGIGIIPLTIWFFRDGDRAENFYGPPQQQM